VRLGWPIVVSLLSFSVMTAVDTAFVGRLGASALAATGVGGTAVFCVLSFGVAVFAAAKVRVGQLVGAGHPEQAHALLGAFLRLAVVVGVSSALLGCLVAQGLRYVHVDALAGKLSAEYAAVRSLSLPLALVSAALGQWRQGRGDSRTAMRAALLANAANVPLNALFIFGLGFGTLGAALATVLARGVEVGWLLHQQRAEGWFWERAGWADAWAVLRVGVTTGLERVLDVAAFLALAVLLARVSPVELAAHQVVLQVSHFCFLPLIALSEAISVLVAQARGAGRPELVPQLARHGYLLAQGVTTLAALLLLAVRGPVLGLFTHDVAILASGSRVVVLAALLQWLCAPFNVLKGTLRGSGDLTVVAWVSVGCAWLLSPPLTWLFSWRFGWGAAGAWTALCIEVTCGVLLLWTRMRRLAVHARRPLAVTESTSAA
jgi:MATE family multidrug resistance protein